MGANLSWTKGKYHVNVSEVLHVAGVLGQTDGLFPWLVTINSALWAATMKHRESEEAKRKPATSKRPSQQLFCTRITTALRWMRALLLGLPTLGGVLQMGALWSTRDRAFPRDPAVRTDASLWSMAGILYLKRCAALLVGPRNR